MNQSRENGSGSQEPPGRRSAASMGGAGIGDDGRELKAKTRAVGEQAKAQVREQVGQQAQTAADRIDRIADSVRAAASELEREDEGGLSHYVSGMAGSLGELAESLRSKNVDELVREVRRMAQRNPALFVTGSIAIGFGLARFARASSHHVHEADRLAMDGAWASDRGLGTGTLAGGYALDDDALGGDAGGASYAAGSSGSQAGDTDGGYGSYGSAGRAGNYPGGTASGSAGTGSGGSYGQPGSAGGYQAGASPGGSTGSGRVPPLSSGGQQP